MRLVTFAIAIAVCQAVFAVDHSLMFSFLESKAKAHGDIEHIAMFEMQSTKIATSIKPEMLTVSKPVRQERKRRVLLFTASWCAPCQALKNSHEGFDWLRGAKWEIGNEPFNHIQIVDVDQRQDLVSQYGVSSLPTLVLIEPGKQSVYAVAPASMRVAADLFNR